MTKLSQIRKNIAKEQRDKYRQSSDCLYFLYVYRLYNDVICGNFNIDGKIR